MANTQSSKKSIRKILKRTARNRHVLSTLKTLGKKFTQAKAAGDTASTQTAAKNWISALDKAAKRGIIHSNKASRHKQAVSSTLFA
jgi:small subunit ribosomal protein S20